MTGNLNQIIEQKMEEARDIAGRIKPEWGVGEYRKEMDELTEKASEIRRGLQSVPFADKNYRDRVEKELSEMERAASEKRYEEP